MDNRRQVENCPLVAIELGQLSADDCACGVPKRNVDLRSEDLTDGIFRIRHWVRRVLPSILHICSHACLHFLATLPMRKCKGQGALSIESFGVSVTVLS